MSTTKTITVPEKWSEVKYKDYYRFVKSIEGQEEDNKAVMEMALQYLCNLDVADYYKLPQETFTTITNDISNLLSNQEKQQLVTAFDVLGTEYRINPNIEDMSYGEYLDLTTYSKDMWANMPIICSILYRPTQHKLGANYTIQPYNGTNDATVSMFRELLTMDIVNGVVGFFLLLQKDLLKVTITSSMKVLKKELTTQQLETLEKSGVDIKQLPHLLETISQNLIK